MNNLITTGSAGFSLAPANMQEAMELCERLAKSNMVPKDYQGKPENIMVAAAMGAELGLKPLQSLQNIAVINGKPAVWGDALMALVRSHPDLEDISESLERDDDADKTKAVCTVKRRGQSPVVGSFSVADAKQAGLWKKQGPWTQYPKRMLQLRARAFALRDAFPDALRGIAVAEEVTDYHEPRDVTPPKPAGIAALHGEVEAVEAEREIGDDAA